MEYLKVKDHVNLVKDPQTNAVINTSKSEYEEYMKRKKARLSETQRVESIENEVSEIRDDLNEIKSLLKMLVKESD
jgi:triacylglycerol esterase/lipase EstA (alpha/beta hydrolase family)